jgi:hypothetical protein
MIDDKKDVQSTSGTPGAQSPMNLIWQDKAQVVTLTAALAAVLTVTGTWLFLLRKPIALLGTSDDCPIVMAGGSFHIHAGDDPDMFFIKKGGKLVHSLPMKVYAIDLVEPSGKITHIAGNKLTVAGKIDFLYCDKINCTGKKDTITLTYDNFSNKEIYISADPGPLDDAQQTGTDKHDPWEYRDWILDNVTALGKFNVKCPTGRCTVIVHTCQSGGPCS